MLYPIIKISGYTSHKNMQGRMVPGCVPYDTDFYTEMQRIQTGYYKPIIEALREITDPEERKNFKSGFLPALTISCTCKNWRRLDNLVKHSGLLNIDIDSKGNEHIKDWAAMRDELFTRAPDIVAAFLSASGQGVTFVVKINPELHLDAFNSIAETVEEHFKLKIDLVAKDAVRLRFVSYDPDARIRYNYDDLRLSEPTAQYWQRKAENRRRVTDSTPCGEADSLINFREAIRRVESAGEISFCEGSKHNYLLKIAGYCNTTGMSEQFCERMVFKHFRHLTHISDADLLQPVRNAYKTYKGQFSTTRLMGAKFIPTPHKRFLLKYVDKPVLKKFKYFYGAQRLAGQTDYIVKVDTPLLVFLMWLIAPEYNWTCTSDRYDKYFSPDDCRETIPDNSILQHVNGGQVWVSRTLNYPANW